MPKHEAGTPKAIANKIKSKGLQKLRWYCQMCQKQCRDENGFKCHLTSESHQRQLLLFADEPGKFVGGYSEEFLQGFMDTLRRGFGTKRVKANAVYQEYIKDKGHVHMNSTKWLTLTGLVQWLGKEGKCKVDNTEKGWFIAYIDRDEEERKAKLEKKREMDRDDEAKMNEMIMKQAQRERERAEAAGGLHEPVYTELRRDEADAESKVEFKMPKVPAAGGGLLALRPSTSKAEGGMDRDDKGDRAKKRDGGADRRPSSSSSSSASKRPRGALDEVREEQERRKETQNRKEHWLAEGIVVKVVTDKLGDRYHRKKGTVVKTVDQFCGHVRMHDSGDTLKLDQAHVETVIPALGRPVLVVNGAYRGCAAVLERLVVDDYCATVVIDRGPLKGRKVDCVRYEDLCKLDTKAGGAGE